MTSLTLSVRTSQLIPVSGPYRLDRTLSCGQAFRWRWEETVASGIFAGRRLRLSQTQGGIQVEGALEPNELGALNRYLGTDASLVNIEEELRSDRVLCRILPHTSGIALMRQDPWECLVSFVVSAFNNIPKIELTIDRLCRRFGTALTGDGWRFPTSGALAAAKFRDLRSCLLGYRVPYVSAIARDVAESRFDLGAPFSLPYEEARRLMLSLPGVGEKVADCVLLFAYGKSEAFPVDVWVKRAVERFYFGGREMTERHIRTWAQDRFGSLAGYAQQHLYYYVRERGTGNEERRRQGPTATTASPRSGRCQGR